MARPSPFTIELPAWLKGDHPAFRSFVALFSVLYVVVQVFGNLPNSALRSVMVPALNVATQLGLYERGWGMFAGHNTQTSTARVELTYADGSVDHVQYIFLKPGFGLSVWNEVMQDLQFDDNNDKEGRYLAGFLRLGCKEFDTKSGNSLQTVAFQQQFVKIPANKEYAAAHEPFTTKSIRNCQST